MPTRVRVVGGHLIVDGVSPGRPDNSLPGIEGPVDPDYGIGSEHPDNTLPPPPPGIWPPPVSIWPPTPLPPDYPMPPGSIWPPVRPERPDQGLPPSRPVRPDQGLPRPPGRPDQGLPTQPPAPDQGLPPVTGTPEHPITSQKYLVAIVGASQGGGLKVIGYTVVDPSLSPTHPIEPVPPGTPQPK
jgi:hypothetical protein